MNDPISVDKIQKSIIEIRGQKVLLDSDVARIYGVDTKRINEEVRNNPEKLPDGYLLRLTKAEWAVLKPRFSSSNRGGKVKLPVGFPEKGLYMLGTILRSRKATSVFAVKSEPLLQGIRS